MKIGIADRRSNARALAWFFGSNLTPAYTSHAELQGYRALDPARWSPDLEDRLRIEIEARLKDPLDAFPSALAWQGVIEARDNEALVGIALVTLSREANVPFGVIEDIVVDGSRRGRGDGETMMRWILDSFDRAGIRRTFLESGLSNEGAHHFFERLGFKTVSVTMMREH